MSAIPLLSGKVFLLVTGASRGIGRQIAESFGALLNEGSLVLLLARNLDGLQETAKKLPEGINVKTVSVDLSIATKDQFKEIIGEALGADGAAQFDRAVIVHNAASVGEVTKLTVAMTDFKIWQDYYNLNVFSPAVLNGVFMEFFNDDTKVQRLVINITSGAELLPIPGMADYCSGKAARSMFFKVFSAENPDVNVLNYSPGPVETDMLRTVIKNAVHPKAKEIFDELEEFTLTTEQTVDSLLKIIQLQEYKSGDYVGCYSKSS